MFFTSTVKLPEIIHDVPAQQTLTASVNIVYVAVLLSKSQQLPDRLLKNIKTELQTHTFSATSPFQAERSKN